MGGSVGVGGGVDRRGRQSKKRLAAIWGGEVVE